MFDILEQIQPYIVCLGCRDKCFSNLKKKKNVLLLERKLINKTQNLKIKKKNAILCISIGHNILLF